MELMHHLTPQLKRLRLSGILETLEARNQQAIAGQWSYVDFLPGSSRTRSPAGRRSSWPSASAVGA